MTVPAAGWRLDSLSDNHYRAPKHSACDIGPRNMANFRPRADQCDEFGCNRSGSVWFFVIGGTEGAEGAGHALHLMLGCNTQHKSCVFQRPPPGCMGSQGPGQPTGVHPALVQRHSQWLCFI